MNDPNLSIETPDMLESKILELNDRLEDTSQASMSRAFNLGCSIGLIPAVLAVIAVFFFFKGSLIGAFFTALVSALGILAFANLSAYLAKARTIQRVYKEQINPDIEKFLLDQTISRQEFDNMADLSLPPQALMRMFLKPNHADDERPESGIPEEKNT